MSLLNKLLERTGGKYLPRDKDEDGHRSWVRAIGYTTEFRRIEAIPRRVYSPAEIDSFVEILTEHLKRDVGTMSLWPIQATALKDMLEAQGGFFPIAVGEGKALISLLAPMVLE